MSKALDAIYQGILDCDMDNVRALILKQKVEGGEFPFLLDAWAMLALHLDDGPMAEGLTFPLSLRWSERRDYATGMARSLYLCPTMIYRADGKALDLPAIKSGRKLARVPDECFIAAKSLLENPGSTNAADSLPAGFRKYHLMMCVTGRLIGTPQPESRSDAINRNSPFLTSFNMLHEEMVAKWDFGSFELPEETTALLGLLTLVGLLAAAVQTPPLLRRPDDEEVISAIVENVAPNADQLFDVHRSQFGTFAELCDFFLRPDLFRPIAISHYVVLNVLDRHFGLGTYFDEGVTATFENGPPKTRTGHTQLLPGPKLLPHKDPGELPPKSGFFRRFFS